MWNFLKKIFGKSEPVEVKVEPVAHPEASLPQLEVKPEPVIQQETVLEANPVEIIVKTEKPKKSKTSKKKVKKSDISDPISGETAEWKENVSSIENSTAWPFPEPVKKKSRKKAKSDK